MNTAADPHDGDGEHRVRLTQAEALTNLRAVLELCAAGEVKRSGTTGRPSAATVRAIDTHLADGDFYTGEAIARAAADHERSCSAVQPASRNRSPPVASLTRSRPDRRVQ